MNYSQNHRAMPLETPSLLVRKELTERQQRVLDFLRRYMHQNGFPPTIVEICREFDFSSTNAATQFLLALERKGYIKRTSKGASRGIQLLDERGNAIVPAAPHTSANSPFSHTPASAATSVAYAPRPLPETVKNLVIIGDGSSLNPMSVFLSPRGQVKADTEFFLPAASKDALAAMSLFAAVVSDDGMSADGIRSGDILIAQQRFSATNNDLVIVLAQEMTLVRRLRLADALGSVMELAASTAGFPPIPYHGNDASLAIIGVATGMMRAFR